MSLQNARVCGCSNELTLTFITHRATTTTQAACSHAHCVVHCCTHATIAYTNALCQKAQVVSSASEYDTRASNDVNCVKCSICARVLWPSLLRSCSAAIGHTAVATTRPHFKRHRLFSCKCAHISQVHKATTLGGASDEKPMSRAHGEYAFR